MSPELYQAFQITLQQISLKEIINISLKQRARGSVSTTQPSGDGSLAYNSSTGVITYTGPSKSETRAHFSGGTGVAISNGEVSIGQSVGTTDDVQER